MAEWTAPCRRDGRTVSTVSRSSDGSSEGLPIPKWFLPRPCTNNFEIGKKIHIEPVRAVGAVVSTMSGDLELPTELVSRPLALIGLAGLNTANTAHLLIWNSFASTNRVDRPPLNFLLIDREHMFRVAKAEVGSCLTTVVLWIFPYFLNRSNTLYQVFGRLELLILDDYVDWRKILCRVTEGNYWILWNIVEIWNVMYSKSRSILPDPTNFFPSDEVDLNLNIMGKWVSCVSRMPLSTSSS